MLCQNIVTTLKFGKGSVRGCVFSGSNLSTVSLLAQLAETHTVWSRSMETKGMDLKAELERLTRKNAELEVRVQELTATCEDLKSIAAAKGVRYEEALAASPSVRMLRRNAPLPAPLLSTMKRPSFLMYRWHRMVPVASMMRKRGALSSTVGK